MTAYRLHYFPESGNSYKLALMLTLCGQSFEPVWTDFGAGVTRTAAWRAAINPMGEIPVLEEDGVRLTQTAPILLRLAEKYRETSAVHAGIDEAERFEVLRWLFWDNHRLTGFLAPYRYMRAFTPSPDPHLLSFYRGRLEDYIGMLERSVESRPFVAGDRATVADLSISGYLVFPTEETGFDLPAAYPGVAAWLGRIAALPGWQHPYALLPGKRLPHYY